MGCDIHIAVEKKVGDKWVMVDRLSGAASDRNYDRFAALCGIRSKDDGKTKPRGIPADVSDSMALWIDEWSGDGHSHSWNTLDEAVAIFLATEFHEPSDYAKKWPKEHYFGISEDDEGEYVGEYRIVYFFDN